MTQRSHYLHLLITDTVRAQIGGRLHRNKAKKLQQMILDHIAQRPCMFVIPGAILYSERFCRSNLDLVDVMRVPEGRENRVCEAQHQNVLCGFLAEKVIDSVCLFFAKRIADDAIELSR